MAAMHGGGTAGLQVLYLYVSATRITSQKFQPGCTMGQQPTSHPGSFFQPLHPGRSQRLFGAFPPKPHGAYVIFTYRHSPRLQVQSQAVHRGLQAGWGGGWVIVFLPPAGPQPLPRYLPCDLSLVLFRVLWYPIDS